MKENIHLSPRKLVEGRDQELKRPDRELAILAAIALIGFLMYLIGSQTSMEYMQQLGLGTFGIAAIGGTFIQYKKAQQKATGADDSSPR